MADIKDQPVLSLMEINALLQAMGSSLPRKDKEMLAAQLQDHVTFLIRHDFERLVQVLYSVDIDENRLRMLLRQQPQTDAAAIISSLIIERQAQKELTRRQFKMDITDDAERW
jgi:hypothetical protein